MRLLGESQFGVYTFFGRSDDDGEKYGPNGLPLTPSSIRIVGRFQRLKSLDHSYLCKYLDIQRGKYDRLFLIVEHNRESLGHYLAQSKPSKANVVRFAFQILEGLRYLHSLGILHGSLSLDTVEIALDSAIRTKKEKIVRLSMYGLPYITDAGRDVDFAIGFPWYVAPEIVASNFDSAIMSNPKIDTWAFGIILLEMITGLRLNKIWKIRQMTGVMAKLCLNADKGSGLKPLLQALKLAKSDLVMLDLPDCFYDLLAKCLMINPKQRPSAKMLLEDPIFTEERYCKECPLSGLNEVFLCCDRTADLTRENFRELIQYTMETTDWLDRPIRERPLEEVFYLWKLAGSSVEVILKRKGLTKVVAPIKSIPLVSVDESDVFGHEKTRRYITDLRLIPLSVENLEERLRAVEPECFFESLELKYSQCNRVEEKPSYELSTLVKERDIEYQLKRMILFDRLINAYPFKRNWLWLESRQDIPPLYRGYVWAALLNVKSDVSAVYGAIDKETYTTTDRQIEVDIPRCHQYDELMSSPEGHAKFKRILKAWIISHPEYVYWQGLDSLSAPFLYLNFNNEALAYASLKAFIPRYLHKFFLKDNAAVIQEYLAVFSHLITFHDPELSLHLQEIGFVPELYAIPWFLTMFAHVFPLHKLFHLWDTLLLGDSSFPLCVGVAILVQLRHRLMHYGFNECILLFSDLPEIDIAKCVEDSVWHFCRTPKSASYRQHALTSELGAEDLGENSAREDRGGSFTVDAIKLGKPELAMDSIPLAELKTSVCTRISAEELVDLMGRKNSQKRAIVVDIRPTEDFNRGTFPGSMNIPYASVLAGETDGETGKGPNSAAGAPSPLDKLTEYKGNRVVVVVGNRKELSFQLADILIKRGFSRTCVLHKGIDVFRKANMLALPPADW